MNNQVIHIRVTRYRWVLLKPDFWEHENLFNLWVIKLISTLKYTNYTKSFWQKIWVKQESGLTTVWLNQDPPVQAFLWRMIMTNHNIYSVGKVIIHAWQNYYFTYTEILSVLGPGIVTPRMLKFALVCQEHMLITWAENGWSW